MARIGRGVSEARQRASLWFAPHVEAGLSWQVPDTQLRLAGPLRPTPRRSGSVLRLTIVAIAEQKQGPQHDKQCACGTFHPDGRNRTAECLSEQHGKRGRGDQREGRTGKYDPTRGAARAERQRGELGLVPNLSEKNRPERRRKEFPVHSQAA